MTRLVFCHYKAWTVRLDPIAGLTLLFQGRALNYFSYDVVK